MQLVKEAKYAHKLWSIQANALGVMLMIAEFVIQVLPLWQEVIPEGVFLMAGIIANTAAMGLRLIKQGGAPNDK